MCEDTEEDTEYALADKVVPQTGSGDGVDVSFVSSWLWLKEGNGFAN